MSSKLKAQFSGEGDRDNVYHNKKHVHPSYEDFVDGALYAFTYNPIDQPNVSSDDGSPEYSWYCFMKNFFKNYKTFRVQLYIEISTTGRWHLHGYLHLLNRFLFCMKDLKSLQQYGTVAIKPIDNYIEWHAYCVKQQTEMQLFLQDSFKIGKEPCYYSNYDSDSMILINEFDNKLIGAYDQYYCYYTEPLKALNRRKL